MSENNNYTEEFKTQIANQRNRKGIWNFKSTISKWHHEYTGSGSFKACDNISKEEKELRMLQKENKRLKMEVDILKQAALIMGRNVE